MHNKSEKFRTQLRHATHEEQRNTAKYPNISQISRPRLDKFQSLCYSKCSKWRPLVSTQQCRCLCHSLIDSVVDRCHWNPWKRRRLPGNAR